MYEEIRELTSLIERIANLNHQLADDLHSIRRDIEKRAIDHDNNDPHNYSFVNEKRVSVNI